MLEIQKCLIFEMEHAGACATVEIASPIKDGKLFNDSYLIVNGNFLDNEIKISFGQYGHIDKFLHYFRDVIASHDLADGTSGIIEFLDGFDVSDDPSWPSYVLDAKY